MIDEAASLLGRTAQRVTTDTDPKKIDFPIAVQEDDEPDAPVVDYPAIATQASEGPAIMVPELAHPGESKSNGLAERSVGALEDCARTTLLALRINVGVAFPVEHPPTDWAAQHAAYLQNTYKIWERL